MFFGSLGETCLGRRYVELHPWRANSFIPFYQLRRVDTNLVFSRFYCLIMKLIFSVSTVDST